jgi:hypothetical protein
MSTTEIITEPSICIPRTLNNVTWRDVKDTFEKLLGKGTVERVDVVTRRDEDTPFCRIFVHMRYWDMNNDTVAGWRQTLVDGGEIKVVHDHPWFWKCVASRVAKPEAKERKHAPYIIKDNAQAKPSDHTIGDHLPGRVVDGAPDYDDEADEYSAARMQAADERGAELFAPSGSTVPCRPG